MNKRWMRLESEWFHKLVSFISRATLQPRGPSAGCHLYRCVLLGFWISEAGWNKEPLDRNGKWQRQREPVDERRRSDYWKPVTHPEAAIQISWKLACACCDIHVDIYIFSPCCAATIPYMKSSEKEKLSVICLKVLKVSFLLWNYGCFFSIWFYGKGSKEPGKSNSSADLIAAEKYFWCT